MKNGEEGFTLMEVLVTVAVVLLLGGLSVTASNTAMRGIALSNKTVKTAETIKRIDRHIRESAGGVRIPYWANPAPYVDACISELFGSPFGAYIRTVTAVSDDNGIPKGVEAVFSVNNVTVRTAALFSAVAVTGGRR